MIKITEADIHRYASIKSELDDLTNDSLFNFVHMGRNNIINSTEDYFRYIYSLLKLDLLDEAYTLISNCGMTVEYSSTKGPKILYDRRIYKGCDGFWYIEDPESPNGNDNCPDCCAYAFLVLLALGGVFGCVGATSDIWGELGCEPMKNISEWVYDKTMYICCELPINAITGFCGCCIDGFCGCCETGCECICSSCC